MNSKEYKSIVSSICKRLLEVKSEKEIKLLLSGLYRVMHFKLAMDGDVDILIKLSEERFGTKND